MSNEIDKKNLTQENKTVGEINTSNKVIKNSEKLENKIQNELKIVQKKAQDELKATNSEFIKEINEINKENNEIEEKIIEQLGAGAEILSKDEPKNKWISLILCVLVGIFGIHKFYEGRMVWGVIYLFTAGLFCIGVIIDIFVILNKPNPYFVDKNSFF